MHSDELSQEKSSRYSSTLVQNKLLLEIDDNVTYKGEIEGNPYFDMKKLKVVFESGKFEVLCKTTSKMNIELLGFVKVQLLSQENRQMQQLKNKILELEAKIKSSAQWEEENLDSKENFDSNSIYMVYCNNTGFTHSSVSVNASTIYINYNGGTWTSVSNSNRRATANGWTVTKILKKKLI